LTDASADGAGGVAADLVPADGELAAVAAAFRGAGAAPFVAVHPQTMAVAPTIQTGIKRTRTMHLAQSSDVLPKYD
jgi:hypothetical protein